MPSRKKEISKRLDDELRAVSFTPVESSAEDEEAQDESLDLAPDFEPTDKPIKKPFSLNKRVVTLEYLDKLERTATASARYEALQEFSHIISNLSLALLSISIITYAIFYFVDSQAVSLMSLIFLSLEAFALLGLTFYSMGKATTSKEFRDMAASDYSTISQAIGNPRAGTYLPMEGPNSPEI